MKVLKDILYKVSLISTHGNMEVGVNHITFDSRSVTAGSTFVAIPGTLVDGHQFISQAITRGATSIISETLPTTDFPGVTFVQVKDSHVALGFMAANFYDNPSEKIKVIAITGTNGKTTIATLLHQAFMEMGHESGLLSTVENKIRHSVIPASHTTPDALTINMLLLKMLEEGCTYCFMEASSHAIVQGRTAGLKISGAIFTNISRDH